MHIFSIYFKGNTMFKSTVSAFALASFAFCAHAADADNIRENLEKNIPGMEVGAITKIPFGDLYQVVGNGYTVFYTDKTGETALFGNLVDLKNKQNLTQAETEKLRVVDFSSLPLDKAIKRVRGNGKRRLALFTDPDCPFCRQLEKELEGVNDITIYTFLLPLTSLHPDSKRKAEQIWCAKDSAKTWDDWMLKKTALPDGEPSCATPIEDIATLAKKLWINGTPALVFGNDKLVPGGINRKQIESNLAEAASKK